MEKERQRSPRRPHQRRRHSNSTSSCPWPVTINLLSSPLQEEHISLLRNYPATSPYSIRNHHPEPNESILSCQVWFNLFRQKKRYTIFFEVCKSGDRMWTFLCSSLLNKISIPQVLSETSTRVCPIIKGHLSASLTLAIESVRIARLWSDRNRVRLSSLK